MLGWFISLCFCFFLSMYCISYYDWTRLDIVGTPSRGTGSTDLPHLLFVNWKEVIGVIGRASTIRCFVGGAAILVVFHGHGTSLTLNYFDGHFAVQSSGTSCNPFSATSQYRCGLQQKGTGGNRRGYSRCTREGNNGNRKFGIVVPIPRIVA